MSLADSEVGEIPVVMTQVEAGAMIGGRLNRDRGQPFHLFCLDEAVPADHRVLEIAVQRVQPTPADYSVEIRNSILTPRVPLPRAGPQSARLGQIFALREGFADEYRQGT